MGIKEIRKVNLNRNLQKNRDLFNKWSKTDDFSLFQFWMKRFHTGVFKQIDFLIKGMKHNFFGFERIIANIVKKEIKR